MALSSPRKNRRWLADKTQLLKNQRIIYSQRKVVLDKKCVQLTDNQASKPSTLSKPL